LVRRNGTFDTDWQGSVRRNGTSLCRWTESELMVVGRVVPQGRDFGRLLGQTDGSAGLLLSWWVLTSYFKSSEDGSDLSTTKFISNIFAIKSFMLIRFKIIYKYYTGIINPSQFKGSLLFNCLLTNYKSKRNRLANCIEANFVQLN
jgi:hypothetical protein